MQGYDRQVCYRINWPDTASIMTYLAGWKQFPRVQFGKLSRVFLEPREDVTQDFG